MLVTVKILTIRNNDMMRPLTLRKKITIPRLLCLLVALVVSLGFVTDAARVAAIPDEEFYSGNDILFYDPDASCGVPTAGGLASLAGNSDAERIWNFLVAKGLTNDQTAGVMGNIQAESGFRPGAIEGGSGIGFGIVQWSFGRRTALEAAAAKKGVPASDLAFQLEYLYQELTARETNRPEYERFPNEWDMLKGQGTMEDALVAFHHEFEISHLMNRPDPRAAVIQARLQFAKDAFASFSKNTPNAGSGSSECEATPTGNLAQTTLAYAWPEYHPANYTTKKGEYQTAIQKAQSQGRYVGGGPYPGVDCGGWVTTLMIDSGFAPAYNSNGKGGNTVSQRSWAEQNWDRVGTGGEIKVGGDTSDPKVLREGDVAFEDGHTFVYVGKIPGFGENDPAFKGVASASYQIWRAPMVGHESMTDSDLTWFRKK
jgi:hypothetical protein